MIERSQRRMSRSRFRRIRIAPPSESAPDPPNRRVELLVRGVGVDRGRERARVPGETLGQVEVFRGAVDVRDGRVAKRVEGVDRLAPRGGLPYPEYELNPAKG